MWEKYKYVWFSRHGPCSIPTISSRNFSWLVSRWQSYNIQKKLIHLISLIPFLVLVLVQSGIICTTYICKNIIHLFLCVGASNCFPSSRSYFLKIDKHRLYYTRSSYLLSPHVSSASLCATPPTLMVERTRAFLHIYFIQVQHLLYKKIQWLKNLYTYSITLLFIMEMYPPVLNFCLFPKYTKFLNLLLGRNVLQNAKCSETLNFSIYHIAKVWSVMWVEIRRIVLTDSFLGNIIFG